MYKKINKKIKFLIEKEAQLLKVNKILKKFFLKYLGITKKDPVNLENGIFNLN